MRISVVLPAHNEAGNIGRLVEETYAVLPRSLLHEVIVVDDCSEDGTRDEVLALRPSYRSLRYLRHGSRAGQSAALRTGILAAASPVIAMMDGDAQNDPADIPNLVAKLGEPGSDGPALVGGLRADRKDTGSKRLASRAANWIRDAVLKDDCPDTGCGIKVYWRQAFMRLPFFTTMHRYLPVLFLTYGYRVEYVPVNDRPRVAGKSKYSNLGRALIGVYDLLGVTWLRRRTAVPPVAEDSGAERLVSERETA
ncbi:Undecaprenyl-phosphate 4-deoxy-4-formamido-L-arabinose transferase [Methyloligella halotolerans]|uniref:Undecaprenyl-phosphate 4-deoxy-4-formamido-L-arabinose transferase n=1 Tax=Methyloligella halotolerans TaxID=1177755 RepID=A0A1E2RZ33_9HYPH|nr:glycosyltransferase family 2 protein [Methyloligella halotolerans]ODA67365.1 Undecaprenyl-phosphate 4-deoxy-4-formamido-L-arabinose transferase [Methyloligella halotolerans]